MPYPHVNQFEDRAVSDRIRRQFQLELEVTRGRSTWRTPKPARSPRFTTLFSRP